MAENNGRQFSATSAPPNAEVQDQVSKFKRDIEEMLSNGARPSEDLEEVLARVQRAERYADEGNPKAWYELMKAKLARHGSGELSTVELAEGDVDVLRQELYRVWGEINDVQRKSREANTTISADWLSRAEQSLEEMPPQRSKAMYSIMRAREALASSQEFVGWSRFGYLAIAIETIYLIAVPLLFVLYSRAANVSGASIMSDVILQLPFYVLAWGFIGGSAWCIYSAAYWTKRRLFDRHYLAWYIACPWLSAAVGSAVALAVLGLFSMISSFNPNSQPGAAILSLLAFLAGFSANALWKLLDRTIRRIAGDKNPAYDEAFETTTR